MGIHQSCFCVILPAQSLFEFVCCACHQNWFANLLLHKVHQTPQILILHLLSHVRQIPLNALPHSLFIFQGWPEVFLSTRAEVLFFILMMYTATLTTLLNQLNSFLSFMAYLLQSNYLSYVCLVSTTKDHTKRSYINSS